MAQHIFRAALLLIAGIGSFALHAHPGHVEGAEMVSGFLHVLSGADHILLFLGAGVLMQFFVKRRLSAMLMSIGIAAMAAVWAKSHQLASGMMVTSDLFMLEFVVLSSALMGLGYFGTRAVRDTLKRVVAQKEEIAQKHYSQEQR